jgi:peptidoglycan/LPS O-acetylase OafA/YrhL
VTIGFFPDPVRNLVIVVGLILLALVATVPVPKIAVRPIGVLAAASLPIYLVQFQMFAFFGPPILKFAASLGAGIAFWAITDGGLRRLQQLIPISPAIIDPPERTAHASTHLPDRLRSHWRARPGRLPIQSSQ